MILVVGATGRLGGMITRQLLAQGKSVRILVRRNSPAEEMAKQGMATSAQALIDAGAQPVYGDLTDRASLDPACAGVETVITTANAALRNGDFASVDYRGTRNLIDAAKNADLDHFIYISAYGSAPDHPHPLLSAKGENEAYLQESGLTYTILKPTMFMEGWIGAVVGIPLQAGQPVTLIGQGARRHSFVSIADVAAYAVAAVDHPAGRNQSIDIGGAAAHSWTEVVAIVGRTLDRTLLINYVAPGDPIPLIPESMGPILAGTEMADSIIDMTETAGTYQIEPTSLDVVAQRLFGVQTR
ncbi:NAD(P)H-binding protein [bacterium]|nr:NAD(P)H-binding protein [bacterium]